VGGWSEAGLGQNAPEYLKNKLKQKKRAGDGMSSNPSITNKNPKTEHVRNYDEPVTKLLSAAIFLF
jgi:hypothetical protein